MNAFYDYFDSPSKEFKPKKLVSWKILFEDKENTFDLGKTSILKFQKSKENSKENLVEKDGEKIQPPVKIIAFSAWWMKKNLGDNHHQRWRWAECRGEEETNAGRPRDRLCQDTRANEYALVVFLSKILEQKSRQRLYRTLLHFISIQRLPSLNL